MGRPLKKDVYGTKVTRSFVGAQAGIVVQGYFGGVLRSDYQIIKQRGKSTYVVVSADADTVNEGDSLVTSINPTYLKVGKLVSGTPSANGEIRILGSTTGQTPGTTAIAKLTKRIARDFSGNRYKWYLDNDSSADVLVLIPV